jgi:hypothetical protein
LSHAPSLTVFILDLHHYFLNLSIVLEQYSLNCILFW